MTGVRPTGSTGPRSKTPPTPSTRLQSPMALTVPQDAAQQAAATPSKPATKPARPKLDPKDFQFIGLCNEVRVKPPG